MITSSNKSCGVALPIERNTATSTHKSATITATIPQPISLKGLANKVLERNKGRNSTATGKEIDRNFSPETDPKKLRADNSSGDHSRDTPDRTWTPGNPFTCECGFKTGWRLRGEVLCPACLYDRQERPGQDPAGDPPDPGEPRRQIVCQGFEHNGVMMSTHSNHCREWQGAYCQGCTLINLR